MNKKIAIAVAIMAASVALNHASAQTTPLTWSGGDLLLGFNADGGQGSSTNVVYNLGLASSLGSLNVNLGGDLSNAYGSNWYSRTDLHWGVFGADDSKNIWASVVTGGTAWKSLGNGNSVPKANLYGAGGNDYNGQIAVNNFNTNAPVAVFENISDTYSWSSFNPTGNAFGFTVGSINNGLLTGAQTDALDIYSMNTTRSTTGTLVTTLNLSSSGTVTAVPEPSTYALFGFGALLLLVVYRRKNA
jgi:hypothetical protein